MDQNAHPTRKVAVADHIWDAFEQMAQEMGTSRDGLINQAMFMFARLNGFLEAGRSEAVAVAAPPARVADAGGRTAAVPPPAPLPQAAPARTAPPPQAAPARTTQPPRASSEDDSQRRGVAERVLETAAELERMMIAKKNPPQHQPEEELVDEPLEDEPMDDEPLDDEPMDDLEPMADDLVGDPGEGEDELAADDGGPSLYMTTDSGNRERITKERFVIGRGKHCDFVINSGKVSREHAQIILDNGEYYIEDLGSSNGTWFQKQRIKRRKIEDGDEYLICNEKVKLALR